MKKMPEYHITAPKEVEKYAKIFMKDLQEKYDNLGGIDKVVEA